MTPNLAEVLPKLAMVCIVALVGASIVSYICSILIKYLPKFGIEVSLGTSQTILISIFIISFLFFFIPLMRRFVPIIKTGSRAKAPQAATAPVMPKPDKPVARAAESADDDDAEDEADAEPEDTESDGADAEKVEEEEDQTDLPPIPGNSAAAGASADMLMFIGDSLEPLAKAGHQLNAFNRFGLTLFFSGAGGYLASKSVFPNSSSRFLIH